ncbi:hypothetical protein [Streptomyces melanogenes]|uniref:hypothetical protein n=1 Tax=Streptomyces melanogenes TaxID=67326 RepID=UPI0037A08034
MTSLLNDVRVSAQWIAVALNSSGYTADFTPESLRDVERFMDEHSDGGIAVADGLLATDLGSRLFALGAYVGETVRLHLGGAWAADDDSPHAHSRIALHLLDGSTIWPVQRVIKRFHNGPEDSIAFYGAALGLPDGSAERRRRFSRKH